MQTLVDLVVGQSGGSALVLLVLGVVLSGCAALALWRTFEFDFGVAAAIGYIVSFVLASTGFELVRLAIVLSVQRAGGWFVESGLFAVLAATLVSRWWGRSR